MHDHNPPHKKIDLGMVTRAVMPMPEQTILFADTMPVMDDATSGINDLAPPGDTIAESLAERGLLVREFVKISKIPEPELRGLMSRRPWKLSRKTARKLEAALHVPVHLWITNERLYRLEQKLEKKLHDAARWQ